MTEKSVTLEIHINENFTVYRMPASADHNPAVTSPLLNSILSPSLNEPKTELIFIMSSMVLKPK